MDSDVLMTDSPDIPANDLIMAKNMADSLNKHYPGHLWAVNVNGEQGMAYIRNLALSGEYGYQLRIVANYSVSEFLKRVVNAGGEILERFRLTRGGADRDEIDSLPVNQLGRIIGDYSRCR